MNFADIVNKAPVDDLDITVGANEAKNVFRKDDPYYRLSPEGISKFLTAMYKEQVTYDEIEKNNESGIIKSDLIIKEYHFSVAQKEHIIIKTPLIYQLVNKALHF